jgi:hypothetical protein
MPDGPKLPDEKPERLVAEDVQQIIWLRLRRMTSVRLCRQIISSRTSQLSAEILDSKADGVASSIRSALGFWESSPVGLNARILSRYYALLQISIAEQVASADPTLNLREVQKHTELGHGLSAASRSAEAFPFNYMVACRPSGHFDSYCKFKGIDLRNFTIEANSRNWDKLTPADQAKRVSLADLFRRVPELRPMIPECLGVPPLSFQIIYAFRNHEERAVARSNSRFSPVTTPPRIEETTYLGIYPNADELTLGYLSSMSLPIKDLQITEDKPAGSQYFVGSFNHPTGSHWWQHLPTYKSGYCGTSWIVPLWETIQDPFIIHFVVLYALSIIVRYLPSLWHEIEYGDLDHIRALIEHYIVIVDGVLPQMAVERITGKRLQVVHPGSMGAPV